MSEILVRPVAYGERRYLFGTVRAALQGRMSAGKSRCPGPGHCGACGHCEAFHVAREETDRMLKDAVLRAAFIEGAEKYPGCPEIQAFVAEDPTDQSVEFLHLRRTFEDMPSPDLAGRVLNALIGPRELVTLRRPVSAIVTEGLLAAGRRAKVVAR